MSDAARSSPSWPAGTALTIVKLDPAGREAARYPGTVIAADIPAPWLAIAATWALGRIEMDGLAFVPGDTLHEFYSPAHPFNVFAIFAPDGYLRGWYANVTAPATLAHDDETPVLTWHDLYLDLVALPDGRATLRDLDELAASGLSRRDPALYAGILAAGDELRRRFAARVFPFHETSRNG